MKKIFLTFLCFASLTAFASCSANGKSAGSESNEQESSQGSSNKIAKDVVEPLFMSEDGDYEYTTQGYRINPDILVEMKKAYGIDGFGRLKGSDVQNEYSFTGEGEFSEITDGFMFEFVLKDGATYGHDVFLGYAKYLYDLCKKAADDGKIVNGFYPDAKEISFDQSVKVVDKKQNNRQKATFYFINQGVQRKVEVIERNFNNGEFRELYVNFKRE